MQQLVSLACLLFHVFVVFATEFTFELPDNEEICFYEEMEHGDQFDFDFQVTSGGNYDVNCYVADPHDKILYEEEKKQYGSFSHTTAMKGVYKACFTNKFSTFSHKYVYLDFRNGGEKPLLPDMTRTTALTQLESMCVSIHEVLKVVLTSQSWYRRREAHDRIRADHINRRVTQWSISETVLLLVISVGQVMLLKSFFTDKKGPVAAPT
ncbi:transmembrane emp24 domain-containing protein 3 [Syngnathus acus]|uniref:transmembrane emp24 domain-containing protein 3 n=1 Tax=Syngnathus acus TaxID=161584 RepID=UPI001885B695|nr:transmembrane emp24 domain-containing protein 3 [Syngnathus acus]